jgi:arginine decarboxylase
LKYLFFLRYISTLKFNRHSIMNFIPKQIFFTKGKGVHKDKLASFELALRQAGIEKCNLVYVSSIFPPNCSIIPKAQGLKRINPGQITFCVMARNETNEPNRLISAAVGLAVPKDRKHYGYISEHHSFGETARKAGDYAEDLAATMLATTLGISFDPDEAWDSRKQVYKASQYIFKSTHICQSTEGNKFGQWTTAIAAAVMLL